LEPDDEGYFVHEYVVGGDGPASGFEGNSLVLDFKIAPDAPNYTRRRFWKEEACRAFALDLSESLAPECVLCHVPSSKRIGDKQYDPRFEMLFECLGACRPDLRFERPWSTVSSSVAAHAGGPRGRRWCYERLRWEGLRRPAASIVLVDDVITTGAHFKACQRMLGEHGVARVTGLFWALALD